MKYKHTKKEKNQMQKKTTKMLKSKLKSFGKKDPKYKTNYKKKILKSVRKPT